MSRWKLLDIQRRLEIETLISSISNRFLNVRTFDVDNVLLNALEALAKNSGVNSCSIYLLSEANLVEQSYGWVSDSQAPYRIGDEIDFDMSDYQWSMNKLRQFESLSINRMEELPDEASKDRRLWEQLGICSILVVPLELNRRLIGLLSLQNFGVQKNWDEYDRLMIRLVGETLVKVLVRKDAEKVVNRRLAMEELVASISSRFISLQPEEIDKELEKTLRMVGEFSEVDRCYIRLLENDRLTFSDVYEWQVNGRQLNDLRGVSLKSFGWIREKLENGEVVYVPDVAALPFEANNEKEIWQKLNIQSILTVPLLDRQGLFGYFGLDTETHKKNLLDEDIRLLRLVGEIFARVLIQKQAQETLRQNQERLKHQVEELRILNLVAKMGADATNEDMLIDRVTNQLSKAIQAENFGILLLDETGGILRDHNSYRRSSKKILARREIPLGTGIAGRVAQAGLPQRVSDISEDPNYIAYDLQIRSVLCVPLRTEERVLGVINVESIQVNTFSEEDERLLTAIAGQLATAIAKVRLIEQSRRREREMEAVTAVSSALRQAMTLDEMVSILVYKTVELFNADALSLFLVEKETLVLAAAHGQPSEFVKSGYILSKEHPLWKVLASGKQLFFFDLEKRPAIQDQQDASSRLVDWTSTDPTGLFADSIFHYFFKDVSIGVIAPLKTTDLVVGLLVLAFSEKKKSLSEEDQRVLTAIAEIAGNAINRASVLDTLEQRVVERTRHLSTLYDISALANETQDLQTILEYSLEKVLDTMKGKIGTIHLLDQEGRTVSLVAHKGILGQSKELMQNIDLASESHDIRTIMDASEPVIIPDIQKDVRLPKQFKLLGKMAYIAIPIRAKGQTLGLLSVLDDTYRDYTPEDVGWLATISEQIGVAIDNTRLRKRAEEIAVTDERSRLARDLHDSVTQALYSANLMAKAARRFAGSGRLERSIECMDEMSDTISHALKEMRLFIYELRPSALEQEGLLGALRQRLETVERRAGVEAHLVCFDFLDLPPSIEDALYRIALEALNNVLKHSAATQVTVTISVNEGKVSLEVEDNGSGMDLEQISSTAGLGLRSMRERSEKLGGTLRIISKPGKGTKVNAVFGGMARRS